jgi:hypothetical protein
MKEIKSNIDNSVLHIIHRAKEYVPTRCELVPPTEFIQCSIINATENQKFAPHHHLYKKIDFSEIIAQESWVVIRGSVQVTYYDKDNSKITSEILREGDITITLYGGHEYEILEDDTVIYEFKTGPYFGPEKDKTYF